MTYANSLFSVSRHVLGGIFQPSAAYILAKKDSLWHKHIQHANELGGAGLGRFVVFCNTGPFLLYKYCSATQDLFYCTSTCIVQVLFCNTGPFLMYKYMYCTSIVLQHKTFSIGQVLYNSKYCTIEP